MYTVDLYNNTKAFLTSHTTYLLNTNNNKTSVEEIINQYAVAYSGQRSVLSWRIYGPDNKFIEYGEGAYKPDMKAVKFSLPAEINMLVSANLTDTEIKVISEQVVDHIRALTKVHIQGKVFANAYIHFPMVSEIGKVVDV